MTHNNLPAGNRAEICLHVRDVILMKIIPFLAAKDLARDRKIALLVVFLLAFSYINLTFFPAFLTGLSNTFQAEVIDTTTGHILIQPTVDSNQLYLNFESSTRKKIDLIPGVVGSSSHIATTGTVFFEGKQLGVQIEALTPSVDAAVTTTKEKIVAGNFLTDSDRDSIVMGRFIAGRKIEDTLGQTGGFGTSVEGLGGADIGEKVRIKFANGAEKEYKIKGITDSAGFSSVSQTIYITTGEAEDVLGVSDQASSIIVRLNNRDEADRYKNLILELGIPSAKIQTWAEASTFAEGINETFGIVILVTTMVGVIIVVSTIGIVVFINTARKKRIIGVLKAIGMQKSHIMLIFLMESLIFGLLGTIIGVAIVYSALFYFAANPIPLPIGLLIPVLDQGTAISAVIILVASSIIAGYFPARMASKQEILETIKVVE